MLCQLQAIPSISSYSASPALQSSMKKPDLSQSRKYLCIELELPYTAFGSDFHWQPVRSTRTMPSNTRRGGFPFLPAPGPRLYAFSGSRSFFGIRGSTLAQNLSDTSHDCTLISILQGSMP